MGRKKVKNKNQNISISLKPHQIDFVKRFKTFDLSKFVQIELQNLIELNDEIQDEF